MKLVWTALVLGLMVLWAVSGKADDWSPENLVRVCSQSGQLDQQCLYQLGMIQRSNKALAQRQADREAWVEQSRQQANGLALFGTGNALVNGMNQGFNNMRLPPYHQPGAQR